MSATEAAYEEVERLVRRFKALSAAERRNYNEAATRHAFILPLFRALEWNVDNTAEVSPEEMVSRGWVDYSFRHWRCDPPGRGVLLLESLYRLESNSGLRTNAALSRLDMSAETGG